MNIESIKEIEVDFDCEYCGREFRIDLYKYEDVKKLENYIEDLESKLKAKDEEIEILKADKWISVEEMTPNKETECIIAGDYGVESGYYLTYGIINNYWDCRDSDGERTRRVDEVTHWQPLPEPPKEK